MPDGYPHDGRLVRSEPPRHPALHGRPRPAAAVAPGRMSELHDGDVAAWLLAQPAGQAAETLLAVEDDRAKRIFRRIAEARPDVAAEILLAWSGNIAGRALGQLRRPPLLVAQVLGAIRQLSPGGDPADIVRVIRHVNDPEGLGAAFGCLPQPLAITLLDQMPHEQAVAVVQEMDPSTVCEMQSVNAEVLGRLLSDVRPGFLTQVNRYASG